jgi:hypothetical protein
MVLRFLRRSRPGERFAAIFVVRRDEGLKPEPTELAAISGGPCLYRGALAEGRG